MNGTEMREAREKLGMSRVEFARLIGFTGSDRNEETRIKRYENDKAEDGIPPYLERLIWMIEIWHRNTRGGFPPFPGYEFRAIEDPSKAHRKRRIRA